MNKESIKQYIRQVAENTSRSITVAKVVAVNSRECEVEPLYGDARIKHVRLNANINGSDGIVMQPAKGSIVLVAHITEYDSAVIMCSELDKVIAKVGSSSYEMKDGEILFNDGNNDGVVNIGPLVDKMNAIEKKVNALVNNYNAHTHGGVAPGGSVTSTTPSLVAGTLITTKQSDIEDTNLKH